MRPKTLSCCTPEPEGCSFVIVFYKKKSVTQIGLNELDRAGAGVYITFSYQTPG